MPAVLTEASLLKCVHGGIFTVTPSQKQLLVGEKGVLVAKDLENFEFLTCPLQPTRCTKTTNADAGVSTTLRVGDQPVLLATAGGLTDQGTWSVVEAGQKTLEAA